MTGRVLVTGGARFIGRWVVRELLSRSLTPVILVEKLLDVARSIGQEPAWRTLPEPGTGAPPPHSTDHTTP